MARQQYSLGRAVPEPIASPPPAAVPWRRRRRAKPTAPPRRDLFSFRISFLRVRFLQLTQGSEANSVRAND
jgi:hypothetical protein